MDFKERLRQILKERGWSVYKLTVAAGLSENTVYNWFRFDCMPRVDTVERVCKALNMSLTEFYCKNDGLPDQRHALVLELFDKIPESRKQAAIDVLKSLSD